MKIKMILLKIAILIIILIVALSFSIFYVNTHPPREPQDITPASFTKGYVNAEFSTDDGIRLKGWLIYSRDRTTDKVIVICHGIGASKTEFIELASYLSKTGWNVLMFDFRAHGESSGRITSIGHLEQRDLRAAITYLRNTEAFKESYIGVYGFSLGGSVAIMAAVDNPEIKAVIAESPFADLGRTTINTLRTFYNYPRTPFYYTLNILYRLHFGVWLGGVSPLKSIGSVNNIMIIAGTKDERSSARDINDLFNAAGSPKVLWRVEGAAHGDAGFYAKDYYERIEKFFSAAFSGNINNIE